MSACATLSPYLNILKSKYRVILASGSPRRQEILKNMGISDFTVKLSGFEENFDRTLYPKASDYCLATAIRKGADVVSGIDLDTRIPGYILISADTIVEIDGNILEKPSDHAHAVSMLSKLSGSFHFVHTGVAIYFARKDAINTDFVSFELYDSFVQTTKVKFIELTDTDINAYIATGEPFDKAGGYGIQSLGGQFVDYIEGCYFNVMGLPVGALSRSITKLIQLNENDDK
jgi:septum formation protein